MAETVNVIFQPIAPNHPIVISCINGGFHAPVNELNDRQRLEESQCNFFIPPFAPVFTPRQPPEGYSAPLVVANTNYIDNDDWKFLGIAFTGCTIDEALKLSMAPIKTAQSFRVAVIVGGSCTVASTTGAEERVTDTIKFDAETRCTLEAPGIPDKYKQSRPKIWKIDDEMEQQQDGDIESTELVVIEDGGTRVHYKRKNTPIALAGVVLDTGPTGDVRILLK